MSAPSAATTRCPCLSGNPYDACCGPLHAGAAAPTAERLMRSRFSAFALGVPEYLVATWHPRTRPAELDLDPDVRWQRLEIVRTAAGGPFDAAGVVEFRAYFRARSDAGDGPDRLGELHETSSFVRERGRWLYVDGVVSP